MQFASSRLRTLSRRLPAGTLASAGMVLLLTLSMANSTVLANWVPGSDTLSKIALAGAALMGVLAVVTVVPWPVALAGGLAAAPIAAYVASASVIAQAHPGDPTDPAGVLSIWSQRIVAGEAATDTSFYLWLLCLLFWVTGGWLAWCTLRWRQPLLGLIPGALAFATNVLNFPTDQNGYVLFFLVVTLALLLWTTYLRSLQSAARRRIKLSGDARWDFWESGVVVTMAVVVLGIFLPPLSTSDRTVDMESGSFRGWAELQQRLNHPVAFGRGASTGNSIGFSQDVGLGGPIHKTGGVVFTYQLQGGFGGPRYFRGLNLALTGPGPNGGEWRYGGSNVATEPLDKSAPIGYAESYQEQQAGRVKIQMLKPPDAASDVIFYPGTLAKVDRPTTARSTLGFGKPTAARPAGLETIDRLSGSARQGGGGTYTVTVDYSVATEDALRAAGSDYPAWLDPYRNFSNSYQAAPPPAPVSGRLPYRPREVIQRIHDLAVEITVGKTTVYDQVTAIESYLRANYQYTLTPNVPPRTTDPIDYFLFSSKEGYCEYFATAMGDMLRSIGIPVRLVNGYGPGSYDDRLGRYVVKESDAHTWVEAYFPGYGWIPFEPTPDGTYFSIPRGATVAPCAKDTVVCDLQGETAGAGLTNPSGKVEHGALDPGQLGVGGSAAQTARRDFPIFLVGLLLLGGLMWIVAARYLRPRSVGGVWKRTHALASLAGIGAREGETPLEFGIRLATEMPEAAEPARRLAERFTVAAYAPREAAEGARDPVFVAWAELRPALVRRVTRRRRPA